MIDVGANRGQFALLARHVFADAAIVSFEPLARPCRALRELKLDNHEVRQLALSDRAGTADMYVTRADDSSSILRPGRLQHKHFGNAHTTAVEQVTVTTLDHEMATLITERPCLLKIDVQGLELDVLRGAEQLLAAVDAVFVECSFVELYEGQALISEVASFLIERGLTLRSLSGMALDESGLAIQADALFVREADDRSSGMALARPT
ncbi:MAG: FkbM family methyltransferase [Actinomycetota bacterium]